MSLAPPAEPDAAAVRSSAAEPDAAADRSSAVRRCDTAAMGFDPTRKHKKTRFDYFYVTASVIVCVALVIWAMA